MKAKGMTVSVQRGIKPNRIINLRFYGTEKYNPEQILIEVHENKLEGIINQLRAAKVSP